MCKVKGERWKVKGQRWRVKGACVCSCHGLCCSGSIGHDMNTHTQALTRMILSGNWFHLSPFTSIRCIWYPSLHVQWKHRPWQVRTCRHWDTRDRQKMEWIKSPFTFQRERWNVNAANVYTWWQGKAYIFDGHTSCNMQVRDWRAYCLSGLLSPPATVQGPVITLPTDTS